MQQKRPDRQPGPGKSFFERWGVLIGFFVLIIATLALYWPVRGFEFLNFDDGTYVSENMPVKSGLTLAGLKWAFRTNEAANWHPLTWLSHMLDCQLFGVNAGPQHLVNVFFHITNACLLFALLLQMTGRRAASWIVAALFAWHPLHVESVAWIAERKDVLSTCFGLLTLLAYTRYARAERRSIIWYLTTLVCFALGLLCKPMLVTLPFLMLLLDYWPLKRVALAEQCGAHFGTAANISKGAHSSSLPRSGGEEGGTCRAATPGSQREPVHQAEVIKSPLSGSMASQAHHQSVSPDKLNASRYVVPARASQEEREGGLRAVSRRDPSNGKYAIVGKLLVEKIPFLLLVVAACVVTMYAQKTYGAMVPVAALPFKTRIINAALAYCGYLVKIFWPSNLAAFYPYGDFRWDIAALPLVAALLVFSFVALWKKRLGCVAVGWLWFLGMLVPVIGLAQVGMQSMADRYTYVPAVGIFIVCVFGAAEWGMKSRATSIIAGALAAIVLVACMLVTQRQLLYWHDSVALFEHAIAVTKNNQVAYNNLGAAMETQGRYREALDYYKSAVQILPEYGEGHCNLGLMHMKLKERPEAIAEFQLALKYNTNNARAHYFLATELLKHGDVSDALQHYRAGLALRPDHPDFHYQLAVALMSLSQVAEAQHEFRETLRISPDWTEALNNLAWSLATQPDVRLRDGNEAARMAVHAIELTHGTNAGLLDTLAAAQAEQGKFSEAVQCAEKGARLAQGQGNEALAREILQHKELYQKGQPFRDTPALANTAK